ncbi:hypothetical protein [Nocardia sp. NBC_00511]|uniref:hypothetical protein n=1 Tax=Nocardia sp. NBC_00511 TaxID=2903591 RepID=UPI0030DF64DB
MLEPADAVTVVSGSWGALSELALANHRGVPVVTIGGWQIHDADGRPVVSAQIGETPAETTDLAIASARNFRALAGQVDQAALDATR